MSTNGHRFTRETITHFRRAVHLFAVSPDGRIARRWFIGLIAGLCAINALNVINSYVGRDFISAIENRDPGAFAEKAFTFFLVLVFSTVAAVLFRFAEERLGLLWRTWQTSEVLKLYLDQRVYYHLHVSGSLENPDQRISEDIRSFTTTTLSFVLMLVNGTVTAVAFSAVLLSISPLLFFVAVVYAALGTLITIMLGKPLVGLTVRQLDKEADFRTELIHVGENAEAVAVVHREACVRERLLRQLETLAGNLRKMIGVNRNLGFFTNGYNYLIQLIPALLVAPLFMEGRIEFGVVTQSAMAFAQLMGAFSLIVTQFQSISSYAAVIGRLSRLLDEIAEIRADHHPAVSITFCDDRVQFDNVTLLSPENGPYLRELELTVRLGEHLLISGDSGHAKIALFKATAGFSKSGSGCIFRPDAEQMLFMPESPYLPRGTLRDVMVRHTELNRASNEELLAVLEKLDLGFLVERIGGLDVECEWYNTLGIGEQALLGIARVLLAPPKVLFLDRMTVALNPVRAARALNLLRDAGITLIVIGKLEDFPGIFRTHLHIARDGTWRLKSIVTAPA
jgi:putative ATP-binding cassette transporter